MLMRDAKIYLGGYALHGAANTMNLQFSAEMQDDTVFGCATRSNKPGLLNTTFSANIFWDPTVPTAPGLALDNFLFQRIGAAKEVLSTGPVAATDGDVIFFTRNVNASYQPMSGGVGDLVQGELQGQAAGSPCVRGFVCGVGGKTTTGSSGYIDVGVSGVPVGDKLFSALHFFGVTGSPTSIVCIVQSDDNTSFTTPTTVLTHSTFTPAAYGASWQESSGAAITDRYFRMNWTIVGAGTFNILGAVGVF